MFYSILSYLENSAKVNKNKIAVADGMGELTYGELYELSKKAGTYLSKLIGKNSPVAVMMNKSRYTLCAFTGTVYAGGFYVLFNPELPDYRLRQMQEILNACVIICDRENEERAKELFSQNVRVCLVDECLRENADEERLSEIRQLSTDTDPLYANFTSGSSGVPKAVLVSHRSVIDFTEVFCETFGFSGDDIIGNQAPFDFDVSVKDIYPAMKTGAKLVMIPRELFSKPTELIDFLCEYEINTLTWAVSAVCLISTFHGLDYKTPAKIKKVLFSGEVMPMKHLKTWMEHLPDTMFVNLYGPTEITCNCTYHIIDRNRDYSDGIPIGKAFSNERVILLDDGGREITEKEKIGEICVCGSCLALGYYGNLQQTSERFVLNPLNKSYPERMYKTGDLASFNDKGELVFRGRKDFQIKHMGHRIELEEIEKRISLVPGVERCCCVFDEEKDKLYCIYIGEKDKAEIFESLTKVLPKFMIPGAFRKTDEMPLTKNGKIDRKKLLEIYGRRKNGARADK